jgi:hypothetical protein
MKNKADRWGRNGAAWLSAILLACQLSGAAGAEEQVAALRPYVSWSGAHSKLAERLCLRITSQEEWAKLWERHAVKGTDVPQVDFGHCMVVAAFQGKASNSDGVVAKSITEKAGRILVRLDERFYQTLGPDGGGVRVTAYGLFVLPRSSKPVVVEENAQSTIGAPAVWKERKRFGAVTQPVRWEPRTIWE